MPEFRSHFRRENHSNTAECSFQSKFGGLEANIHSIDLARALLLKHTQHRHKPIVALLRSAFGHRAMIVADGANWQATRDALTPAVQSAHLGQAIVPVIWAVTTEWAGEMASRSEDAGWVTVPFETDMRMLLARVMGFAVFGQTPSRHDGTRIEQWIDIMTRPIVTGGWARINRLLGAILHICHLGNHQPVFMPAPQRRAVRELMRWIGDRVADGSSPMLANLEQRYAALSPRRRRRRIAAECAMVFVAGIDTTAAALTFAMAEIASDPKILNAVLEDSRSDGATARSTTCRNPVATYPVIHRVVQETLRRHTIVPTILREAASDCQAHAVAIRRGTVLRFLPIQGHLRAKIWPQPKRFDPGRFAQPLTPEQRKNYNPFGLGPQSCVGRSMATYECVIVLAALFQKLDVRTQAITRAISVQRNAMFTNRPVGVTVELRASECM